MQESVSSVWSVGGENEEAYEAGNWQDFEASSSSIDAEGSNMGLPYAEGAAAVVREDVPTRDGTEDEDRNNAAANA